MSNGINPTPSSTQGDGRAEGNSSGNSSVLQPEVDALTALNSALQGVEELGALVPLIQSAATQIDQATVGIRTTYFRAIDNLTLYVDDKKEEIELYVQHQLAGQGLVPTASSAVVDPPEEDIGYRSA
jgi:hypothetical protein